VELATRVVNAFNRRDLDAFAEHCTADVEWFSVAGWDHRRQQLQGTQGMERYFEIQRSQGAVSWSENDEYRSVDDRVACMRSPRRDRPRLAASRSHAYMDRNRVRGGKVSRAASFTIAARRCGRWAWPSSGQVPVSGDDCIAGRARVRPTAEQTIEGTTCERVGESRMEVADDRSVGQSGSRPIGARCASAEVRARALGRPGASELKTAVADIIGARRAWTVEMISSMSIPCK